MIRKSVKRFSGKIMLYSLESIAFIQSGLIQPELDRDLAGDSG